MTTNVPDPAGDDTADESAPAAPRDHFLEGYAAGLAAMEAKGPLDPFLEGDEQLLDLIGDVPVPRPANGEPTP